MNDIIVMSASVMYKKIEHVQSPKEALEVLAKAKNDMDWLGRAAGNVEEIRFRAYGLWLHKNNEKWFYYLKALNDFAGALQYGALNLPGDEPEGWIDPLPYFKGELDG